MTTTSAPARPDGVQPRRWWALAFIALAQLMITLDTTIVTIALPSAQDTLDMSDANRQWVVTGYTLAFGGLLLLGGRIADRVGRKRTLLIGILGFAVVSAIGGLADSGTMLVLARAGQGLFAALLAPSTLALLATMFTDPAERAKAIGIYTAVLIGGGAMGLVGGGLITSVLNWRWCMYVNVPIALVAAVGALLTLPDPPGRPDARVDVFSAVTGCGGIVGLVFGFAEAGERGWHSDRVVWSLSAAAVLLVAFIVLQARMRDPLLPLRILADRNRGMAFATVSLASLGLFGVFLFLTFQLQVVMGYSALRTGVALLPLVVMNVLAATQLSGRLMPKLPPRMLIVPGLLSAICALLLLTRLTPDTSYAAIILPVELLLGLGIGSLFGPCVNIATSGVDPRDAGVASATVNTAQQVGASLGTALLNTIAASATATYLDSHSGARAQEFGIAHGYAVAAAWAAGILMVTAVLVTVLITADPRKKAAQAPEGEGEAPAGQPDPQGARSGTAEEASGASDAAPAAERGAGEVPGRHVPQPEPRGLGSIIGTVIERTGCMWVSGAALDLVDADGKKVAAATSDGNGCYEFADLPAGEYALTATHEWYRPRTRRVVVEGDTPTRSDLELLPAGRVLGVVRGYAGTPVRAASVSIADRSGVTVETTTAADGSYSFTELPAGEYVVRAAATGFRAASDAVTVAGGEYHCDIPLDEGESAAGLG